MPITLLDTIFRKHIRIQRALCIQLRQALKQLSAAAAEPVPRRRCREDREEKSLPLFPSVKLFSAHMPLTGTLLTFSWQSNPVIRDVFSFAPAALVEINTPMFPPAERFPKRCKVPGCPSACWCTVSLLTRRKAGPSEMKQKKSRFLTASAAKRERDVKNKTSLSPRRCTVTKVLHGTAQPGLALCQVLSACCLPNCWVFRRKIMVSFSSALLYRAKHLPNALGKALLFPCLRFPAHTSGFLCSTHTNQRNPPVSEALGCCWTPSSHSRAGTSHKHLLGWSCQTAPYEAGRLEMELSSSQHLAFTGWDGSGISPA